MSSVRLELAAAWREWIPLTRPLPDPLVLHPRLLRFAATHAAEEAHIKRMTANLARGQALVAAALDWQEPVIQRNARPTASDRARGLQWRLVMAYGGLETIVKSLLAANGRGGLSPEKFSAFAVAAVAPAPSCPRLSRRRRELEDWLLRPASGTENPVIEFLGLERGDAEIVERWLVSCDQLISWEEQLRLTKALRNATAHGALTSSRASKWGIVQALDTLTLDIGRLTTAALRRLLEPV